MNSIHPEIWPKLSVIVAVRNAENTIARALDSLAAQHYPNVELIVWDGASTDGTLAELNKYSHLITIFKSEPDQGSQDAYNKAVALATGDYIGFLNADDEYEPGALWAVADTILKQPDAELIIGGIIFCTLDKNGYSLKGYYADRKQLAMDLQSVLTEAPTFQLSRFLHRDLFAEVGEFNTDRNLWFYSNDREFAARLALRGCRSAIIPKALCRQIIHNKSISNNPGTYNRIIEEHILIADMLMKREGLTEEQKCIIRNWRKRQLVFGLWDALVRMEFDKTVQFMKQGFATAGWKFPALSLSILAGKALKRLCLKTSHGIASR